MENILPYLNLLVITMRKCWNEFWSLMSVLLLGGKDISQNLVTGTVSISAAYKEVGGVIEDSAKDLRNTPDL